MSSPPPSSSSSAAAAAAPKICFNPQCKEAAPESPRRKGWRLRSGDFAVLCERCSYAYDQGSFCDTFHVDAAGWRNCESCAKRVHCGCIVSAPAYQLLDAGGVECAACARKTLGMVSERAKDFPVRSWNQMAGPFPGQWRQAPHLWNTSSPPSELQQRLSYELDRPNSTRKLIPGRRYTISLQEKKTEDPSARIPSSNIIHVMRDRYANGNTNLDSVSAFNAFHRELNADGVQSGHQIGETDTLSTKKGIASDPSTSSVGVNFGSQSNSCISSQSTIIKDDPSSPLIGLAAPLSSSADTNDPSRVSATEPQLEAVSPLLAKQIYPSPQNTVDSCGELQAQMRNGRPRIDAQARNQLLPRYWPRITEQELQQISGDSNSVITPLFEKILSASDAGRIGRLVLPKKCAEAYFPTISQPEGQPLKVQDATGKDWVFQFRFWPNNNSRMYVLEGVTPCIQSMQLQAGDTVTFSRIDPEGKLVMGFRKACSISTEQENQTLKDGNGVIKNPEINNQIPNGFIHSLPSRPLKGSIESRNQITTADNGTWSKSHKAGFIQKDGPDGKNSMAPSRRKGGTLSSRSKRLRIDNEESNKLKLTWEEAQELLRPPPNHVPNVVVIDGHEFEEYEEAPVLGKPTFFTTNQAGDKYQWAQCEDCSKWRKLPIDALLPYRWTCSDNIWDPERSSCLSAPELSRKQLADLMSPTKTGTSKRSRAKVETDNIELSDGLETLANLAILGEGETLPSSSQPTTRHPRHRPGCTCIVCIQPPSGKGPKHKQTCTCNVCLTVQRRFRTLMLRREKRQSEKEAETARKQQQQQLSQQSLPQSGSLPIDKILSSSPQKQMVIDEINGDESDRKKQLPSPLKTQIDLNIQPEREEEPSPVSNAGSLMTLLNDTTA